MAEEAGNAGGGEILAFRERLRRDPESAFEELVRLYRGEVFDLCVRVSGNRGEAEDLTQEVFLRAYEHLDRFRGDAHPRTWLYRIAINQSISLTRRLKRWRMRRGERDESFPEFPELAVPSGEGALERREEVARAHRALAALSPRQRAAVVLRVIKELPYAEVAKAMGITVGGAKANVHQGLKNLRSLLEETG